jgi:hypothetical protein
VGQQAEPRRGCVIAGELFKFEFEDETVYLKHREWSLMGMGDSERAAEQDLLNEARQLYDVMATMPPHTLSDAASRLRDFLRRVV